MLDDGLVFAFPSSIVDVNNKRQTLFLVCGDMYDSTRSLPGYQMTSQDPNSTYVSERFSTMKTRANKLTIARDQ
jgi:hypothetical protein